MTRVRTNLGKASNQAIRAMDQALESVREMDRRGEYPQAMELLETVFQAIMYWEDDQKKNPELYRIFDETRKLAGKIRGEMATAVMQGAHWMGGLELGLHTDQEREEALAEVDLQYRVGLNALDFDHFAAVWAIGFLNGIQWLAESEGAQDLAAEARSRISDLRSRLLAAA